MDPQHTPKGATRDATFSHSGGPCVTPRTIPQTVLFSDLFDKPLVATFNQEHASSDGGAVLLKAAERVYGLVKAFARCLADKRAAGKIRHTFADLSGQRLRPDRSVQRDHFMMFNVDLRRDPHVGASLSHGVVPQTSERRLQRRAAHVAGQRHATRTSSRTKCNRIRPGSRRDNARLAGPRDRPAVLATMPSAALGECVDRPDMQPS